MHVESFGSTEEMVNHLRQNREAAHNMLHSAQRSITWGDHWVQFAPTEKDLLTVWGRVETREEIAREELHLGSEWPEVVTAIEDIEAKHADGLLYGRAHDRFNVEGDLGYTHRAHIWPIEKRLHDAAADVGFDHRRLQDAAMRLLLEIAYKSFRAHVRSQS